MSGQTDLHLESGDPDKMKGLILDFVCHDEETLLSFTLKTTILSTIVQKTMLVRNMKITLNLYLNWPLKKTEVQISGMKEGI